MIMQSFLARGTAVVAAVVTAVSPTLVCGQAPGAGRAAMPVRGNQRIVDVSLDRQGVLSGVVVTPQGAAVAGQAVSLAAAHPPVATTTDAEGRFQLAGVRGGVQQVVVGAQAQPCRVWAPGTAPPSAVSQLLVVEDAQLALAQNCGSPVAGGMFGAKHALANPLVVGGIVAAAIAIPIAVHNSGDDDPSS